jgi:hypothetical protein
MSKLISLYLAIYNENITVLFDGQSRKKIPPAALPYSSICDKGNHFI